MANRSPFALPGRSSGGGTRPEWDSSEHAWKNSSSTHSVVLRETHPPPYVGAYLRGVGDDVRSRRHR
jgi:hypothetical protein